MARYLIEFRFFGKAKREIKELVWKVNRKFRLSHARGRRPIPHITLVAPFTTIYQKKLVSDFKEICSKQPLIDFEVKGYGTFTKTRVVYIKIKPSKQLKKFRWNLSKTLRKYCKLLPRELKRKYYFHATIAMKIPSQKFKKIKKYVKEHKEPNYKHYLIRATLLKNSKILYEYDFLLRRLLNRKQAKSKIILEETFIKLSQFINLLI